MSNKNRDTKPLEGESIEEFAYRIFPNYMKIDTDFGDFLLGFETAFDLQKEQYTERVEGEDCPNCNAGAYDGKHCYDCGTPSTSTKLFGVETLPTKGTTSTTIEALAEKFRNIRTELLWDKNYPCSDDYMNSVMQAAYNQRDKEQAGVVEELTITSEVDDFDKGWNAALRAFKASLIKQ